MTLSMLIAYDDDGNVIGTLDWMIAKNAAGDVIGLVDFAAHEAAGGELTDVWEVSGAKGSKPWPEWIGGRAHDFRVELAGPPGSKRISALVHKVSGRRRNRAAIDAAIAERIRTAKGTPDLRDLVGGPTRHLRLDAEGRTMARPERRTELPTIRQLLNEAR